MTSLTSFIELFLFFSLMTGNGGHEPRPRPRYRIGLQGPPMPKAFDRAVGAVRSRSPTAGAVPKASRRRWAKWRRCAPFARATRPLCPCGSVGVAGARVCRFRSSWLIGADKENRE